MAEGSEALVVIFEHVLVELNDALEFGEVSLEGCLTVSEPIDLLVEFASFTHRCVGQLFVFLFEIIAFLTQGGDALLVGIDVEADVFEVRAGFT